MNVVTRKHLLHAEARYPEASRELRAWYKIASAARWQHFLEVRNVFPDADAVGRYLIFNIRRNRYRLITIAHYARPLDERITVGHLYIRAFLTHKQYDNPANWDQGVDR